MPRVKATFGMDSVESGGLSQREGAIHLAACAVSGALLALAFPEANLYPLAWLALAPFFYCIYRLPWKLALLSSFAYGAAFVATLVWWISLFGYLPLVLLAALVSLIYFAGFAALAKALGSRRGPWSRLIALASLWVFVEWVSSLWITGFPWWSIGTSQSKALPLAQISSVTGVWGVSFLLALSNAAVANAMLAWRRRTGLYGAAWQAGLVVAVAASVWVWGAISMASFCPDGRDLRVGVAQGNIAQNVPHDAAYVERIWQTYRTLTTAAAAGGAKLVVWPEGTVPGRVARNPVLLQRLSAIARDSGGIRLLAGGRDEGDAGQVYNCAFLVGLDRGLLGRYAKVHLVPFAEFVVLRDYLPYLKRYRILPYDVSPGGQFAVLGDSAGRIGAVICFESVFPQIARRMADSGAQILCVITNDGWFGRTAAAEQHVSKAVFRAIENRRYLVRCASTGISCIVDPCGLVVAEAPLQEEKVLVGDVVLNSTKSFYTRHGEWFVYVCIAAAALVGATSLRAAPAGRRRLFFRR